MTRERWRPSGKIADLSATYGVQGTPQLSPDTVSSVANRRYRHGKGISRKRLAYNGGAVRCGHCVRVANGLNAQGEPQMGLG